MLSYSCAARPVFRYKRAETSIVYKVPHLNRIIRFFSIFLIFIKDTFIFFVLRRAGNRLVSYVYHPGQPGEYGDDFDWGPVETGIWYHVEMHVLLNTPGEYDGLLEALINGRKVLEQGFMRF